MCNSSSQIAHDGYAYPHRLWGIAPIIALRANVRYRKSRANQRGAGSSAPMKEALAVPGGLQQNQRSLHHFVSEAVVWQEVMNLRHGGRALLRHRPYRLL